MSENIDFEKLKDTARELLEPYFVRHYETTSEVHWVTQDGHDIEGDYCEDCIEKAVKNERKLLREERQKILAKFKEIEETGSFNGEVIKGKYPESEIKKAKRNELKNLGVSKFSYTYNYGGGIESDSFLTCELCDRELAISILYNEQHFQDLLDDMEDGKIDDQTGYRASELLYEIFEESDLSIKLAKRVIEILSNKEVVE